VLEDTLDATIGVLLNLPGPKQHYKCWKWHCASALWRNVWCPRRNSKANHVLPQWRILERCQNRDSRGTIQPLGNLDMYQRGRW
jgi:hypothetical protein